LEAVEGVKASSRAENIIVPTSHPRRSLALPREQEQDGAKTRVQSVARASRLLVWIAQRPGGGTASEAARATGLTVPTTYHLLNTMVDEGLLAKDSRRRYGPGPRFAALCEAYLRTDRLPDYLLIPLRVLADRTGETAYVAGWRGHEIRTLSWIEGRNAVRVAALQQRPYRHANTRALGKLLLAYADEERRQSYLALDPPVRLTERSITEPSALDEELRRIRAAGYATDDQEFAEGVACASAPMIEDGVVVAAYTVSAPADRFARHRDEYVDAVRAAAAAALETARRLDLDRPDITPLVR
jgi:IclR family transcriptional regulator, acetate operon repressor